MKILFVDGTKGYSPTRLGNKPTGGIATSLTIIPRFLASKGHEVWVKSLHDKDEVVAGVNFLSRLAPAPPADIVVLNRNMPTAGTMAQIKANGSVVIWWLHDIVDYRYLADGSFKAIDNIVALSRYCADTYSDFYDIPGEKFTIIPNGVDSAVFHAGPYVDRDPNLFVFASAPVKGFKALGFVIHNLKRILPSLDFRIYSSQRLHDLQDGPTVDEWKAAMTALGAKVFLPIPQKDLADVLRRAWCLLMPNEYPEICSNLLLQAQACGCPVITSPIGSAPEWITHGETGILTKWLPHDKFMWWADFAKQVMRLVADKDLRGRISERSIKIPLTWEQVGGMWEEYLGAKIEKLDSIREISAVV